MNKLNVTNITSGNPTLDRWCREVAQAIRNLSVDGVFTPGGDLTGSPSNQVVSFIQGVKVVSTGATVGQALVFNGSQWQPGSIGGGSITFANDLTGTSSAQSVVGFRNVPLSASPATANQVYSLVGGIWTPTTLVHGNQGGGTQHTPATSSLAGFMSAADKAKLDNVVDWTTLMDVDFAAQPATSFTQGTVVVANVGGYANTRVGTAAGTVPTQGYCIYGGGSGLAMAAGNGAPNATWVEFSSQDWPAGWTGYDPETEYEIQVTIGQPINIPTNGQYAAIILSTNVATDNASCENGLIGVGVRRTAGVNVGFSCAGTRPFASGAPQADTPQNVTDPLLVLRVRPDSCRAMSTPGTMTSNKTLRRYLAMLTNATSTAAWMQEGDTMRVRLVSQVRTNSADFGRLIVRARKLNLGN